MKAGAAKPVRCAIYTRVSTDQGLEQDFNSRCATRRFRGLHSQPSPRCMDLDPNPVR
jgi:hypothetical protein